MNENDSTQELTIYATDYETENVANGGFNGVCFLEGKHCFTSFKEAIKFIADNDIDVDKLCVISKDGYCRIKTR